MYSERVKRFLASLGELPDFAGIDLSDINRCATDGDNALHFAVRNGDLGLANDLIEAGIEINKAGDLGYTPLHVACICGNLEMVKLLIENGADVFALSEGYPPFTTARLSKQDRICDLLDTVMTNRQSQDPKIWIRARIVQLKRELARLEAELNS
jgi:ankyrin repeat protein